MYDEIMNRPMFQTPQQRQGAGIMAGVAPIRGYADGDLVEDDDSMIASLLGVGTLMATWFQMTSLVLSRPKKVQA